MIEDDDSRQHAPQRPRSPESPRAEQADSASDGAWVTLISTPDRSRISEAALVLESMRIAHQTRWHNHAWSLLVPPRDVDAAVRQLRIHALENAPPPRPRPLPRFGRGGVGVLIYWMILMLLPNLEAASALGWAWRDAGVLNAELVRAGEVWRAVTALTLHADLGHLVANAAFGALFGLLVTRYLGVGFGWLLILCGGALGNLTNALLQADGFQALGASTANFAALGLSGAWLWRLRRAGRADRLRRFAPLFGAVALLVYTGVGGERTDVLGHFAGFAVGALIGLAVSTFDVRRLGKSGQMLAGVLALGILALAWQQAGLAYAGG